MNPKQFKSAEKQIVSLGKQVYESKLSCIEYLIATYCKQQLPNFRKYGMPTHVFVSKDMDILAMGKDMLLVRNKL